MMNDQTQAVGQPNDNHIANQKLINAFKDSLYEIVDGKRTLKAGVVIDTSHPLNNRELMQSSNKSMQKISHSLGDTHLDVLLVQDLKDYAQFVSHRLYTTGENPQVIAQTFRKNGTQCEQASFDKGTKTKRPAQWKIKGAN